MVWIFLGLGIALLVVGVMMAVLPTLRADRAQAHAEGQEEAWAVLSQPVAADELIRLPKDQPVWGRLLSSRFLQGSIVGAGSSLLVAGIVLSYALILPGGLSAAEVTKPEPKAPETAAPAPQVPAPAPVETTPATPAAPEIEKPPASLTFTINSGELSQEIAFNLKLNGFIEHQGNFLDRLAERELETMIQIGEFKIPADATIDQVIDIITRQGS